MTPSIFLSSFISLRRMKTPLRIGDQDIYPGASLPECRVRTVEVSFPPESDDCQTLQHLVSAAVKFMYTTFSPLNPDNKSQSSRVQSKAERARRRRLLQEIKDALNLRDDREGSMAMALHRILTLISFDMRNHRLLFDKGVYNRDPLVKLSADEVRKLHKISNKIDQTCSTGPELPGQPAGTKAARKSVSAPMMSRS